MIKIRNDKREQPLKGRSFHVLNICCTVFIIGI